jgi:hypothetical protein
MDVFDSPMSPRLRQEMLQKLYPEWEIWFVPRALGGFTWCARRDPRDIHPFNADLPRELAEYIEEAEKADRHNPALGPETSEN